MGQRIKPSDSIRYCRCGSTQWKELGKTLLPNIMYRPVKTLASHEGNPSGDGQQYVMAGWYRPLGDRLKQVTTQPMVYQSEAASAMSCNRSHYCKSPAAAGRRRPTPPPKFRFVPRLIKVVLRRPCFSTVPGPPRLINRVGFHSRHLQ